MNNLYPICIITLPFAFAPLQNVIGSKSNIIIILADDLGYTDVNCFATRITNTPSEKQYYETPNINRLAQQGVAFDQAYACPLSSPARASILTGKYAMRLGFQTATGGGSNTFYMQGVEPPDGFHEQDCYWSDEIPNQSPLLNGHTLTALPSGQTQDKGRNEISFAEVLDNYHSAFLGKWHIGGHGSEGYQPHNHGFEELAYYDSGGSQFFNWQKSWNRKNKHYPKMRQDQLVQGKSGVDLGIKYLTDDLTQRALDYIDNRADCKENKPFLLYLSHFAVHWPFQAPEETIQYFENKKTKGWKGHSNATYAAMIKHLDNSVGAIMDKLIEKDLDNNTIIIFMSDNGGISEGKGDENITNNKPLKGQKATVYEGGIRVPLIVSYKGKIKGNNWCSIPVDCNDIFPTIIELASETQVKHEIDGQSIAGLLIDTQNKKKSYTRDTFFWHYPLNVIYNNPEDGLPLTPHSAIRKGDYKLIFDWYGRLRLYNLKNDISETNNLSKKLPQKTKELFKELITFLDNNVENKYMPTQNHLYDHEKEIRCIPYINLYQAYKEGKDIVELSN